MYCTKNEKTASQRTETKKVIPMYYEVNLKVKVMQIWLNLTLKLTELRTVIYES